MSHMLARGAASEHLSPAQPHTTHASSRRVVCLESPDYEFCRADYEPHMSHMLARGAPSEHFVASATMHKPPSHVASCASNCEITNFAGATL